MRQNWEEAFESFYKRQKEIYNKRRQAEKRNERGEQLTKKLQKILEESLKSRGDNND